MADDGPHARARRDGPADLAAWAGDAASDDPAARLARRAGDAYADAWPDAELLTFRDGHASFWFDTRGMDGQGREPRTVAGWGRVPRGVPARDKGRQAGHPLSPALAAAGYERGHLVARASGGGMDANLFPQAWQVNQGRSVEGKEFRRLERLAADNPGALVMTRLVYTDDTVVPRTVHLLVAVAGRPVEQGLFGNEPVPRPPPRTDRLRAGTAFHRTVQTGFVAGLVAATAAPESPVRLADGRNGRVDLLVLPDGPERRAVVVEVKNTDWDALAAHRVRPNLRSHVRQLQKYLDPIVDELDRGVWDSVAGVLLYPRRPRNPDLARTVERLAEDRALTVVWHDQTDWKTFG